MCPWSALTEPTAIEPKQRAAHGRLGEKLAGSLSANVHDDACL